MKTARPLFFGVLLVAGAFLFSRTPDIGSNLSLFYAGFLLASAGYVGLLVFGLPGGRGGRMPWLLLLMALPRLFALNLAPSDDLPRYVWEGRVLLEGVSPYAVPPDDPRLVPLRDDEIYPGINHKDMPAIYPPLTQYLFALLSLLTHEIEGYRLALLAVECLAILALFGWLRALGRPLERVAVYALNPLVVISIAGRGHLDSLQILLLVLGLTLHARGREGAGMVVVTLAALTKFLALFALVFLVRARTLKHLPLCLGVVLACYLPLVFLEGSFSMGNLGHYLHRFEYYSLTFAPLRWMLGTTGAQIVTAAAWLGFLVSLWLTRSRPEYAVAPFLLLVTLTNTTVHSWYLAPLLALAPVWRSRALIGLSILFFPSFHVWQGVAAEGVFEGAVWRQLVTYLPFLLLLWLEKSGRWPAWRPAGRTLGVVVPVLDDAGPLERLLRSLGRAGIRGGDVVVADGGSTDGSRTTAERWGARVVLCPVKGRGQQIARGVEHLDTDLVLVLHADCVVPPALPEVLRRSASAYPDAAGGAFRTRYDSPGILQTGVSALNNAKTGLLGLSFGDQGQWFRRSRIRVPEIPLMEDVEMALRINDAGGSVWTPAVIEVSTRRYAARGAFRVALSVVRHTLSYLIRRRWHDRVPDTGPLYREYYGREPRHPSGG